MSLPAVVSHLASANTAVALLFSAHAVLVVLMKPDDMTHILFSSGTTGEPKVIIDWFFRK